MKHNKIFDKEGRMMFGNFMSTDSLFGKVAPDLCRLTPSGAIAVKTSSGYKSYNVEKKILTNQSNFVFDLGGDFFFLIPTNKAKVGDILLVNGRPVCVIEVNDKEITAINYENSLKETIIPERHVFLGKTYFYGKIYSVFGSALKKGRGNMMKNMMQFQILQSMLGGNMKFGMDNNSSNGVANSDTNNGGMGNMMQMMLMMNMFGGGNNGLGSMFDGMFDFDDDEDETETIKKILETEEEDN